MGGREKRSPADFDTCVVMRSVSSQLAMMMMMIGRRMVDLKERADIRSRGF